MTQKSSLLALNAVIIVAQAGEHGRSFAVVADEVRNLAQGASSSTDRINQIIEEMQNYTRETVSHITLTHKMINEGMLQGEEMADVLSQIPDSSQQALEMTRNISQSTQQISGAVSVVRRSVEKLGGMSAQVSKMANRIIDEMDECRQGRLRVIEDLRRLKQAKKSAAQALYSDVGYEVIAASSSSGCCSLDESCLLSL